GSKTYLNALQNYPLLQNVQTNLYKCFLCIGDSLLSRFGIVALIHQKGIYDAPSGKELRGHLIPRLRWLLHFSNKMMLFDAIKDEKHYEVTVASHDPGPSPAFNLICNLFHPSTLQCSEHHDGAGSIPGLKTDADEWDVRPHRNRIVAVDRERLCLFARLY